MKFTKGRVFVVGFFLTMLLAIPATVFMVGQQLTTSTKAEKSTTLSFSPVSETTVVGEKISFDIYASPGTNLVNYIKIVLKFDPSLFSADEGSFVADPNSKLVITQGPTTSSGSLSVVLSTSNPSDSINSDSKLGSVTFDVLQASSSSAQISFDSDLVQIRSVGSSDSITENVFLNGTPATVTFSDDSSSSSTPEQSADDTPTLLTPSSNESVPDQTPVFEGTAKPNETVNITINSSQTITAKVTADSSGNWTYTPTTQLEPGNHTVTISSRDSNGVLQTITKTFSVLAAEAQAAGGQGPICTSLVADVVTTGDAPYTIGFTAKGDDSIATINKVTFTFGDGGTLDVTQGGGIGTASVSATATHTYLDPGTFNATATLTNTQGSVSDSSTCSLPVTISGSSSSVSPIPPTGPSPAVLGIGAIGGVLLLIGALLFFVL